MMTEASPIEPAARSFRDPLAPVVEPLGEARPDGVSWAQVRGEIVFSSCNEDSESEVRALQLAGRRRVLCVTAGGGRVLNLVSERPSEIWAVDLNPAQNHLLELKMAAMQALDHGEFLEFLGVRSSEQRVSVYRQVRSRLSPASARYFDRRIEVIERGVLLEGHLERFLAGCARILGAAAPFGLKRLFEERDLGRQQALVRQLDASAFRLVGRNLGRRRVLELFSGDPGFYRYLPPDLPLHEHIYDSVMRYLASEPVGNNHLLSVLFFGRYVDERALPRYLNERWYDATREALSSTKIRIFTGYVDKVLASAGGERFDAFSLSDISSYLDDAGWARLLDRVLETSTPGARVCSRGCLHHRELAPEHAAKIRREPGLERELGRRDHAMVHRFLVGEVAP